MLLTVKRRFFNEKNTIGELFIDGKFFCFTLEDIVRDLNANGKFDNGEKKIYGETAIPYGQYKVILSKSARFKKILPEVLNVPDFSGIRFHGGNTEADSLGCVLVAYNSDRKKIWGSASNDLVKKLTGVKDITLEVVKYQAP